MEPVLNIAEDQLNQFVGADSPVAWQNPKTFGESEGLYPLASRAASQLHKDDAKGHSLTVKLHPLASRGMSHAEYQSRIFGCRMRSV
jgi:hypothetical protein